MDAPNLESPEYYLNYELSLAAFNRRVLEQAQDPRIPLLERMRFLCITSSNLDEFFEVRVARLIQQVAYGSTEAGPDGLTCNEVLARISKDIHELVTEQYRMFNDELLPQMAGEGIRFLARGEWTAEQRAWIEHYFRSQLLPIVSPIRLDPAHPFPARPEQELTFHRRAGRSGCVWSSRWHGRCASTASASSPHPVATRDQRRPARFRVLVVGHPRPGARIVSRHAGDRMPSISGPLETATCSWTLRKPTIYCGR